MPVLKDMKKEIEEELSRATARIIQKLHNYDEPREAFYGIRDEFVQVVTNCSDNLRVVLYIEDVLDEPIVVRIRAEKNRLIISIKNNGNVEYRWK